MVQLLLQLHVLQNKNYRVITLDEGDGSGHCPGIGTEVYAATAKIVTLVQKYLV